MKLAKGALGVAALAMGGCVSLGSGVAEPTASEVLAKDALLTTAVGGLERTEATTELIDVDGPGFTRALRVTLRKGNLETNATQLTLLNTAPIARGEVLVATFFVRGRALPGGGPARIEFLFEQSTSPWTKSASQGVVAFADRDKWRKVMVPFQSAGAYGPGQAMASFRMAFGPQVVELGGVSVASWAGAGKSLDAIVDEAAKASPIGALTFTVNRNDLRQTIMGLGGNFCQPRYGSSEALDNVGRYVLDNLNVVHARIGLPLNHWNPQPGVFKDEGPARASLQALAEMTRRRIPTVVSVWEGPRWMLGGQPEQMGRSLPRDKYAACIDAIARYLLLARDKYRAPVDYVSFNEPDYGVNFKFTPKEMADFIRQAGRTFAVRGLRTKFVVADTANGTNFYDYARPLLADRTIAPYLGPLAFHSWDALSASDEAYANIAKLGSESKKAVWCLEAGHDAQLWQQPNNPWNTWENALRIARAYERTIRLTGASLMSYWTYQDNYTLVSPDGKTPYPAFHVMRQMQDVFTRGARVASVGGAADSEVQAIATVRGGRTAVLLVNPSGPGTVVLRGLPKSATVRIELSDRVRQRRPVTAKTSATGEARFALPARSVVTVVAG